jgi:hypothetical protein
MKQNFKHFFKGVKSDKPLLITLALLLAVIIWVIASIAESAPMVDEVSEPVTVSVPEVTTEVVTETETATEVEDEYTFYDVPLDIETQKEIIKICDEYGIRYELILGIIKVECTSFNPEAIGDGGNSFGLMQIQPRWWSGLMEREGVTNLLDPLENIRCGCAILKNLKNKYDTEYRALQAYNTGNPDSNSSYADRVYSSVYTLKVLEE